MKTSLLQNKLQESLSEEHTKKVEYEAVKCEKEKQLQCVSQELHQYKNLLAKEKTFAEKLRGDFNMLQVYVHAYKRMKVNLTSSKCTLDKTCYNRSTARGY